MCKTATAGTRQRPTRDDINRYLMATPPPDTAVFDTRDTSRFGIIGACVLIALLKAVGVLQ